MPGPGSGPGAFGRPPSRPTRQGEVVQTVDAPPVRKRPPGHLSPATAFFDPRKQYLVIQATGTGAGTTGGTSGLSDAAGEATGELPYSDIVISYDDTHILNEIRITRGGGTTQTVTDVTSQSKYLKRTFERSDVHTETDTDSYYAAAWILDHHKDPVLRVESITVQPQRDPDRVWSVILGLELLDTITVVRRPQGIGSPISENVVVQGIAHDVTPETWTVTLQLAPASPHNYWFWDRSTWDGGDYWAAY